MEFLNSLKVTEYKGQPVTVAQEKFDGYYAEVYAMKDYVVICTKGQKVNLWPKLKKQKAIREQIESLPAGTVLRCELHAFNVPATSVPTLINDADDKLLLSPFTIEQWRDSFFTSSFQEERLILMNHGFTVPLINRYWNPAEVLLEKEIEWLKNSAKECGIEGYVLKDGEHGCWKIKPQKTVDAFVVECNISESDTYAGGLKSVTIAVLHGDKVVRIASVGSGFEGDYRMKVDRKTLIGRVGEFKYQSLGAKGRLKFPRFLRWRDDEKAAVQCKSDQLKGFQSC